MPNLRVIYNNLASSALSITTSTSAGSLIADNLLTDLKSEVWRATTTSGTITATWATSQLFGGVALPFCNFTSLATIRVTGYAEPGDGVAVFDTGVIYACAAPALGLFGWGVGPLGANAYSYSGGAYARAWLTTPTTAKQIIIELADTTNPSGYIEVSRLVTGAYWSPAVNADYGAIVSTEDTSEHFRTDAGDLLTDVGTRNKKQTFNLSALAAADRASLWNILRGNGMSEPLFFSLFPNDTDATLEQTHQTYGKLVTVPGMSITNLDRYAAQIDIEEI